MILANIKMEIRMEARAALLAQLNETVAQLLATYQALPEPGKLVYELWSAKDVLAHLTFWHESFARNISDLAREVKPRPLKGKLIDLNQQGVDEMRPLALEQVLERFSTAHGIIQANILNPGLTLIPYKKGSRDYSPEEHLEIVIGHIQLHLKDVKAAH
jgi:hypothetical protein